MRYILAVLVLTLATLYFTVGLRLGSPTLTETYLLNATGTNTYTYATTDNRQRVGVTGACRVRSGAATVRLLAPDGTQIAGQTCREGEWSLNVLGGGQPGTYRVTVDFERYTGRLNLQETHTTAP